MLESIEHNMVKSRCCMRSIPNGLSSNGCRFSAARVLLVGPRKKSVCCSHRPYTLLDEKGGRKSKYLPLNAFSDQKRNPIKIYRSFLYIFIVTIIIQERQESPRARKAAAGSSFYKSFQLIAIRMKKKDSFSFPVKDDGYLSISICKNSMICQ